MVRSLAALLVVVALIGLAPAAPVPKHLTPKEPLCYATQKGTRWVYAENGIECEYEATNVKPDKRGGTLVTIERVKDGKNEPYEVLEVSPRGLFVVGDEGRTRKPPTCLLSCPVKLGNEWPYRIDSEGLFSYRGTMKVTGVEDVKVPAGTFSAVRVEKQETFLVSREPHTNFHITCWFAPNVGLVKEVQDGFKKELKSFTPGNG